MALHEYLLRYPSIVKPTWANLTTWLVKGGYALADQVVFGASHFILNIFLARWLSPAEYGVFTVGYSSFNLAAGIHAALLLEPMLVFGSGRFVACELSYFKMIMRIHLLVTGAAGTLMLFLAFPIARFYGSSVAPFVLFATTTPVLLLFWTVRRFLYVSVKPGLAFMGSAIYCALIVGITYVAFRIGMLSSLWGIGSMALAALIASITLVTIRYRGLRDLSPFTVPFKGFIELHWAYGKWALASSIVLWVPLNSYYLILPVVGDMGDSAAFRAMMNFVNPALQVIGAMTLIVIPKLARDLNQVGISLMNRTVVRFLLVLSAPMVAYFLVLSVLDVNLFDVFYGGRYSAYTNEPQTILGFVLLLAVFTQTIGGAIRAMEQPKVIFKSYALAAFATIVLGVPLMKEYKVLGAAIALSSSYLVIAVTLAYHYRKAIQREVK